MVKDSSPASPRPAATLIICRETSSGGAPQLLLAERSEKMRFAGGATVFPGGQVDPSDFEMARAQAGRDSSNAGEEGEGDIAARIAAIRETLEETGLAVAIVGTATSSKDAVASARAKLLQSGDFDSALRARDWSLELDHLTPFARWLPLGLNHSHIFDTRFYIANIGTGGHELSPDSDENSRLFWMGAQEALLAADRGEIKIIFPTRRNLERIAQFDSFDALRSHAQETPIQTITPWTEEHGGRKWLTIPTDAGYPVCREELHAALRG